MSQTPESISALDNIEELVNSVKSFVEMTREENSDADVVTIGQWLENVALLTEADTEDDSERNYVTLMTIHSAKGLEFDNVFIVGMEDNLFPSQMCMTSIEGIEEERRLFYVALTRAKTRVVLSLSQSRYQWGKPVSHPPSRFLKEIDAEYVDVTYGADCDDDNDDEYQCDSPVSQSFGRPSNAEKTKYFKRTASEVREKVVVKPVAPDLSRFKKVVVSAGSAGSGFAGSGADYCGSATSSNSEGAAIRGGSCVFAVGDRVRHDKFGIGVVKVSEDSPSGAKYTVDFDGNMKTLLAKFAKLERVE